MAFKKATKSQAKARIAIDGPSGSGKTKTALRIARGLAPTGRIALIDSESGSASKYAKSHDFDTDDLVTFSPEIYISKILEAEREGYDVIIIDSLSHAWAGAGGALEIVDGFKDKFGGGWRKVTPMHNRLVDTILRSRAHIIATMRTHTEYVLDEVIKEGRKVQTPRKVGTKPIQRAGIEYEFDVVLDIDIDHDASVSKTRCEDLDGYRANKPGEELGEKLRLWLSEGAPVVAAASTVQPQAQPVASTARPSEPPAPVVRAHEPKVPIASTMATVNIFGCQDVADVDSMMASMLTGLPAEEHRDIVLASILRGIDLAASPDALKAVFQRIGEHKRAGRLSAADEEHFVRPAFVARKAAISAQAA